MKCKYCGIETGCMDFCSMECSDAVFGFDNKLKAERAAGRVVEFDETRHEPDIAAIAAPSFRINRNDNDMYTTLLTLAHIDPRLPGIMLLLNDGETQTTIAKSLRITQPRIQQLISEALCKVLRGIDK